MHTSPQIVEKDFWVVWTLKKLYEMDFSDHLFFRGGTSLSKVYEIIHRFSEDIDLAINRKYFGFNDQKLISCSTISQQERLLSKLNKQNKTHLKNSVLPQLQNTFSKLLPSGKWNLKFEQDERLYWLTFSYPPSLSENTSLYAYIRPEVKIELYANQDNEPWHKKNIIPYIANYFKDEINLMCPAKVVSMTRTFYEKVALIHSAIERNSISADRFSRHLYDIYCISKSDEFNSIINNKNLFFNIIKSRKIFYRQPAANYDKILQNTLNLDPKDNLLNKIKHDYIKMEEMIYGPIPSIDKILKTAKNIQNRLNYTE
ncbi:MAG: nucleotidyl transferase AbiEii/AbiGii toxin family protein [Candidatus Marinimicrobia bacterium]|nr:nucleotidyl transferase AbiEii/AbiGii toxin family protein [Candidatus Neomarinimicrobiota bacterium]